MDGRGRPGGQRVLRHHPLTTSVVHGRLVVLFDADCGFCQATVHRLRRWDRDGALEFVTLQSAASSGRAALERAAAEFALQGILHVVDEGSGATWAGGDAALAIVDVLPGGWLLRPWRSLAPWRLVVGIGYDLVARHRHELGHALGFHGPACEVAI